MEGRSWVLRAAGRDPLVDGVGVSTRWVVHADSVDQVDMKPLLGDLADAIADDAQAIVAAQSKRTGRLELAVHVDEVTEDHAIVAADPRNPRSSPEEQAYAYWMEKGTSDTPAEPFLRPATWIYRTP